MSTITSIDLKEVEESLVRARVETWLVHPFFGNLISRLPFEQADAWCDTAATDGRKFYYNSAFIASLKHHQLVFLYAHEILHNAFEHHMRRDNRDPKLWNVAVDYAVNQILVDDKIGQRIEPILQDDKYRGMAAEEIYEDLLKNAQQLNIDALLDKLVDEHMDMGDGGADEGVDEGDESQGNRPKMTSAQRQKVKEQLKAALIESAQAAGNAPSGVARLVESMTAPKVSWKDVLRAHLQSTIKSDYTFLNRSKKSNGSPFIMPGMKRDETINICVGIDCSGSIDNKTLSEFMSELNGIMSQYNDYQIHVWSYDTQVYDHVVFRADEGIDITSYTPRGGGGTCFEASYLFMQANDLVPDMYLNFTDGFPGGSWGDETYCETIFCICTSSGRSVKPPFGTTIYLKDE